MRFNHRRRQDEGGFTPESGGVFDNSPPTPPHINQPPNNELTARRGELGDFSPPLHVERPYLATRSAYVDHTAGALATCTPTPPAGPISSTKSPQHKDNCEGGFSDQTPPVEMLDRIALPVEVIVGLRVLRARPAPPIARPAVWREVVDDSLTLAADGWARRALDLGWDAADVFGTGPDGDASFDGLAVWLGGRKLVAVTANSARTDCGAVFYRETFLRPLSPRVTPAFLWDFQAETKGHGHVA